MIDREEEEVAGLSWVEEDTQREAEVESGAELHKLMKV
jgi:hypothetical protein